MLDLTPSLRRAGLDALAENTVKKEAERVGYFDQMPHLATEPINPALYHVAKKLTTIQDRGTGTSRKIPARLSYPNCLQSGAARWFRSLSLSLSLIGLRSPQACAQRLGNSGNRERAAILYVRFHLTAVTSPE